MSIVCDHFCPADDHVPSHAAGALAHIPMASLSPMRSARLFLLAALLSLVVPPKAQANWPWSWAPPFLAPEHPAGRDSAPPIGGAVEKTRGGVPSGATSRPHPAVVRVIASEGSMVSYGSGSLVVAGNGRGIIVTNWHVVRDHRGPVLVVFPGGFQTRGITKAVDRLWDLAAVEIPQPPVEPLPLASQPPTPGEDLLIAGYGRGSYRAALGQCTGFASPNPRSPPEMVEVSVTARKGDSGGPILNSREELAGVLFGAGSGRTTGSHVVRVRQFLRPWLVGTSAFATTPEVYSGSQEAHSGSMAGSSPAPLTDLHPPPAAVREVWVNRLDPPQVGAAAPGPGLQQSLPRQADQTSLAPVQSEPSGQGHLRVFFVLVASVATVGFLLRWLPV